MSVARRVTPLPVVNRDPRLARVDDRTREILARRKARGAFGRRGWLVRRLLAAADVLGLSIAFVVAGLVFGRDGALVDRVTPLVEFVVFLSTLPVWVVAAKLYGLYERDEERTDHSTASEVMAIFHVVSTGVWIVFIGAWLTRLADPNPPRLALFWGLAIAFVATGRAVARSLCRRSMSYLQNAVIIGAGDVGQLVARKLVQHPEYGINLVGLVDSAPKERREELGHVPLIGGPEDLPELVKLLDIERVIFAFSNGSVEDDLLLVRSLRELGVQVDIVPRFFDIVGPRADIHTVEGLPLLGLPPARLSRSSRFLKRCMDVAGALVALVLTAPLFAFIAWRIKRDSPGPVFFRQTRLGVNMREFTLLKFRTMKTETDEGAHREHIMSITSSNTAPDDSGLYKLDRGDAITPFGRWLRKTSLDELPQLINVLRGDMSLVGPRPCIPYELEGFAPHLFERFLVPAGMTGLWQVTARAHSSFGEALDMDVAYARGWSLGLDLQLILRTPVQVVRQRSGTV